MPDSFYTHVITGQGLAFLAKQQLGAEPNITRAVAGAGFVDPIDLESQTAVLSPIGEMEVGPRTMVDSKIVRLPLRFSSGDITDTALIRQIGVYAEDPDEGEILYQLLQYSVPQPLPSLEANRGVLAIFECEIDLIFANGELAQIPTSPSWFISEADLEAHNTDPQAHQGRFIAITEKMDAMEQDFTAWQEEQDARLQLMEDTLITDIQDNKTIIVFSDLSRIKLLKGVYNQQYSRIEC